MEEKIIYLDNAATTQVDKKVIKTMNEFFSKNYGNASSLHDLGVSARKSLENAREIIAKSINACAEEIFFTSGGTESNNWALKGIAFANREKGNHIITTKVEHKCILETCNWLENQGFNITYLNVDSEGFVNLEELKKAIDEKTILVSIIHGNNEIGTINDLDAIAKICESKGVYFHTDACQSYMKTPIDVKKIKVDLITLNAHKIHGPKGVGALYIRKKTKLESWQHGGFQENNLRSGTENIPAIIGFAEAVKLAANKKYLQHMSRLRDKLIENISKIPHTKLNGPIGEKRLCNNVNFSFRFIEGEAITGMLNLYKICSSTGSACTERNLDPNHVLQAIGLNHEMSNGSLRLTLSRLTKESEIDYVSKILPKVAEKLRGISPFKEKKEEAYVLERNN